MRFELVLKRIEGRPLITSRTSNRAIQWWRQSEEVNDDD